MHVGEFILLELDEKQPLTPTKRVFTETFNYFFSLLNIQALKKLRVPEIKPFIIFVKPPEFDRLAETRTRAYARSTFVENGNRAFTVGFPYYKLLVF